MRTRLLVRLAIAGIALVIFLFVRIVIQPTRVTFHPANMSIDVGKGWKEVKTPATSTICSPRLASKSGMINALLLDEDATEVKAAAENLQTKLVAAGKAPADAFKQQEFSTASGLAGVHLSYTAKSPKSGEELRSHHFITRNMLGRYVSISYITSPELESSDTVAVIAKTLRVE